MDWLKFKLSRNTYSDSKSLWTPALGSFYDQPAKSNDGKDNGLKPFAGKVTVIMNVACFCGYTAGSYPALQKIHDKYAAKGFSAIGFPCNQFGAQEPGTDAEIQKTVNDMKITFPLMAKIDVNGDNTCAPYKFLKACFPGDIQWNFSSKFVVDRAGVCVKRFEKESWEEIDKFVGELVDKPAAAAADSAAAPAAK